MSQRLSKMSRNLNVVQTFNDFSLDTQIMDFSQEDLVDYVIENADVFYWLNIESIWGRCGFIWDTYENQGHFNNVSIKFDTLPKVPDPHRIKTFKGLFTNLDDGTYTINDNNWEHIDTIGDWGSVNQTIVMNMPSANFTKISLTKRNPVYYPFVSLDNIDWSTLGMSSSYSLPLKISSQNKDIVRLDIAKIFQSTKLGYIKLVLDNVPQDQTVDLYNIPDPMPKEYQDGDTTSTFSSDSIPPSICTLYRQYDPYDNLIARPLFHKYSTSGCSFLWSYLDIDNPPISTGFIEWTKYSSAIESKLINCKVLPVYRNSYIHENSLDIPYDYDIFNNPDHKVRYHDNSKYQIRCGTAYYRNTLGFTTKLNLRVNTDLVSLMEYKPSFEYKEKRTDLKRTDKSLTVSYKDALNRLEQTDDSTIILSQMPYYYLSSSGVAYATIAYTYSGITFYSDSKEITYNSSLEDLYDWDYYGTYYDGGTKVNNTINIVKTDPDHKLIYSGSSYSILMLQDIYYKAGVVYIPRDTSYKIIFDDTSNPLYNARLIECNQQKPTIPNVFDFTNVTLEEGYEVQDKVNFTSFRDFLFYPAIKNPSFITVDETLDLILKGTIYIVNKPTKGCHDLMKFFSTDYIFEYPLSRVKQVGTPDGSNHKIHLEGGYVLSLDENATVGDAEGVEYFLSKFKFRSGASPRENSLFLNSEQYALFTADQIKTLNDNGWDVVEVII